MKTQYTNQTIKTTVNTKTKETFKQLQKRIINKKTGKWKKTASKEDKDFYTECLTYEFFFL